MDLKINSTTDQILEELITRDVRPADTPLLVVGIGASAGGLSAFQSFFSALQSDSPTAMAFVVVQHLSPNHKSNLVSILQASTSMPVVEASSGTKLVPNSVYVTPPNRNLCVKKGSLQISNALEKGERFTIDFFFKSLASEYKERAICIILSGNGTDGTNGAAAIRENGGTVFVQDPDSADNRGMPESAVNAAVTKFILPVEQMPSQLIRLPDKIRESGTAIEIEPSLETIAGLNEVCAVIRLRTGHEFSNYKRSTLLRRVERRMSPRYIGNWSEYVNHLDKSAAEVSSLLQDLMIGVTSFFRDPIFRGTAKSDSTRTYRQKSGW